MIAVGSSLLDRDLDAESPRSELRARRSSAAAVRRHHRARWRCSPHDSSRARPRAVVLLRRALGLLFDHVVWPEVRVYDPHIAASLLGGRELMADRQAHAVSRAGIAPLRDPSSRRHCAERLAGGRALSSRAALAEPARRARPLRPSSGRRPRSVRRQGSATSPAASVNARALEIMARRLRQEGVPLIVVPTPANSPLDRNEALLRRLDQCLDGIGQRTGAIVAPSRPAPDDFPPPSSRTRCT